MIPEKRLRKEDGTFTAKRMQEMTFTKADMKQTERKQVRV